MYGAFWCSHCYDQKQTFGQEAYRRIRYVECAPDGVDSQTKLCRSRKVGTQGGVVCVCACIDGVARSGGGRAWMGE